ncbi:hypothetical protein RFI_10920 [Reticulomyxa filosa]|uniref:Uncharacterized protein n=1 Tax=Reticulomyxa filosa TaxID=46433 RepID=X6NJX8_RETFI|nr:hypothetical protein RFI_10920 [Reticulomyxa filosa]|eukprot:ETO26218.1 hypothetical protein RFI_10920 [Reticulomyxa filosa]
MSSSKENNNSKHEDEQLLRLTIQQALQAQHVLEQTRGIDRFLTPFPEEKKKKKKDGKGEEPGRSGATQSEEVENSLSSLMDKKKKKKRKSKNRHLMAGFSGSARVRNRVNMGDLSHYQSILSRLSRELSAIGLSADSSFLSLTNKRCVVLDKIVHQYQKEYRLKGDANTLL